MGTDEHKFSHEIFTFVSAIQTRLERIRKVPKKYMTSSHAKDS